MSISPRTLKDGTTVYDASIRLLRDEESGNRRKLKKTFRSKAEARTWEPKTLTELRAKARHAQTDLTVADYLTGWLKDVVDVRLARTTAAEYRWTVDHRIVPHIGTIELADLSGSSLQRWISTLTRTPSRRGGTLSRRSIEGPYRVLHSALAVAVRQRILPFNPADGVVLPRADRGLQRETWSLDETRRFLQVAQADAYEPLWTFALHSGMRRGEILGLRWQDIDWEQGTASVRQTLTKAGSEPIFRAPKNPTSRRSVPLPNELTDLLAEHRERQQQHIATYAGVYEDLDLIFCTPCGLAWYPDTVTHRFTLLVEQAGVRPINFHYTRHTYSTLAAGHGESLAAVSEVLGHADRRTTLTLYQHVEERQRQQVAKTIAGLLMGQNGTNAPSRQRRSPLEASTEDVPEEERVHPWPLERQTVRSVR